MALAHAEKLYIQLCIKQLAIATKNNSNAIRQLALAHLYQSSARPDEAASQIELVKESLARSDSNVESAIDHIATALGIER